MQPGFIIIDEDGCCNVHCVDQSKTLGNTAFSEALFNFICNVDKSSPGRNIEP
jgi:hypothetical protein